MPESKKKTLINGAFILLYICLAIVLLWRCKYGFASVDETFYLATPHRLLMGDSLLSHEWHQSQLSTVLMLPLLKIYMAIMPGTEGMVLHFRYLYTVLACLAALYIFLRLRKLNEPGAFLSALCLMLYAPFGVCALSYNSMGIIALALALVTMHTAEKHRRAQLAVSGLFYAMAVLCCPYLALGWLIQAVIALIKLLRKDTEPAKDFALFSLGVFMAAAVFMLYLLGRTGLSGIMSALPHILNDPEHPFVPFLSRVKTLVVDTLYGGKFSHYIYVLFALLFALCLADRKRAERGGVYLAAAAALSAALLLSLSVREHINLLMFPVNLLGLTVFVINKDVKIKKLFYALWLPGMLYALCIHFASNLSFIAFSSASSVAALGSVLMLSLHLAGKSFKALDKASAAAFMLLFVALLGLYRVNNVYFGQTLAEQTVALSQGVQKGIVSSEPDMQKYYPILEDVREIEERGHEKLLFLSVETACYIEGGFENCGYSSWLSGVTENTMARLRQYWALNPEKLPEAIYTEKEYYERVEPFAKELGLNATELEYGYLFD